MARDQPGGRALGGAQCRGRLWYDDAVRNAELTTVREYLRDAVAILASPAEAQRRWLEQSDALPLTDELAIAFDDWFDFVPRLLEAGLLSKESAEALQRLAGSLDALQRELANDPSAWDAEQLDRAPAWDAVRRAAGLAVVALLSPVHAMPPR